MELTEIAQAINKAATATRMVKQCGHFTFFEELVGEKINVLKTAIEQLKSKKNELVTNHDSATLMLSDIQNLTYAAYFILSACYTKNISLFFEPYSRDVVISVCSDYRTKYKPHVIRVKANLDILEEEYKTNTLFEHEDNIYESLEAMWLDVKTLRQYSKEILQYRDELDQEKKKEEDKANRDQTDKKSNVRLQIGLLISGIIITSFWQDIYNYGKKITSDSTGVSRQENKVTGPRTISTPITIDSITVTKRRTDKQRQQNNLQEIEAKAKQHTQRSLGRHKS
jgi:hypothetical protein